MDLGRRYTDEEIQQIQTLIGKGHSNRDIAIRLNRSEAGIRNIRHRNKLKTDTKKTLQTLLQNEKELKAQLSHLQREVKALTTRRDKIQTILRTEEQTFNQRLQTALIRLKENKPELFRINIEEQLGKLAGELTGTFLKWIIS